MKTATYNNFEYEVQEPKIPQNADYKWYRRTVPPGRTPPPSWKFAGIFLESLDVIAWVWFQGHGWEWRIKRLSWYDEGVMKTEEKAMEAVEQGLSIPYYGRNDANQNS